MDIGPHGRYILEEHIGTGSYGEVWKARCRYGSKMVAVKISKMDTVDTLLYESKVMQYLKGITGVVPLLSCGKMEDGRHYLAMEALGPPLSSIIRPGGMPERYVKTLGRSILHIIESVHRKGFLHRDIKPDNFLFTLDGDNLMIADYGFCKLWCDDDGNLKPKMSSAAPVGTSSYMSIDVHMGMSASRKDDLESFCYMLLELLHGTLPWKESKYDKGSNDRVCSMKRGIAFADMAGKASWLRSMLGYVRSLTYETVPNYGLLREMLQDKV